MSTGTLKRIQQRPIRNVKTKGKPEKTPNSNQQKKQSMSKKPSRVKDLCIQHIKELNHNSFDDIFSTDDNQLTLKKRKHVEDEDDFFSNGKIFTENKISTIIFYLEDYSIEKNFTSDLIEVTTVPSYHNLPSATHQLASSITIMPAGENIF
jgi:hypothetical protein